MGNSNLICHQCIAEDGKWVCADSHRYVTITESGYPRAQATSAECKGNQATTLLSRRSPGSVSQEVSGSVGQLLFSERPEYSNGAFEGAATIVTEKTTLMPFIVGLALGPNCLPLAITVSPDDDPSVLTIDDVFYPGLIADWNSHHSERLSVFRGDIIIGVNSFAGNGSEMLEVLSEIEGINRDEMLLLHIKPGVNRVLENFPREFSRDNDPPQVPQMTPAAEQLIKELPKEPPVMLTEDGKLRGAFIVEGQIGPGNMNLGIAIGVQNHPHHLTIEALWTSGLIARWNQANTDKQRVRTGDLITGVNNTIKGCIKEQILNEIDDIQKNAIHQNVVLRLHMEPGCMKVKQNITHGRAPAFY